MYTTHNNNKYNTKSNIIQIAEQIQQDTTYQNQALSIINAYRKIENIPTNNSNSITHKKLANKSINYQPSSQYNNKVKQTLKQLNVNRKKYIHHSQDIFKNNIQEPQHLNRPAQIHLIQSGIKRLFKVLLKKYQEYSKIFISSLLTQKNLTVNHQQQQILHWKLKRIFSAWQYEVMLMKIQKQRKQKQQIEKQKKWLQLAVNFYYFWTCKKIIKIWHQQTKKIIKKKLFQKQQLLINCIQKQKINVIPQNHNKCQSVNNAELQNKVRGFLDDLKLSVQNKNKLNVIQEKPQQLNCHENLEDAENIQPVTNEGQPNSQQTQNQQSPPPNTAAQAPLDSQPQPRGPLTNQDLQKRRKQLQKKSKHRKQCLDKLKRQKQQKRKLQQQQKNRIDKQLQLQQKKIKQQLYHKFIKQKKQKQSWEIKQKLLNKQALQFNLLRLQKYYGWIYWSKLKSTNQSNITNLASIITKILLRHYLQIFCNRILIIGQQKLQEIQQKMTKYHSRNLKLKSFHHLKLNKQLQLTQKLQYQTRHEVFTLKIYFTSWLHARQSIQLQNYQWQRPRLKKAQSLHLLTLLHKSFQSFKINRDQSIQNKNILSHKAIIKNKVQSIVQEKPTINYDDYL